MGRAPRFWTDESFKLISENFIPVSVSNIDQNRKDAVGEFVRAAGMQFPGAGGSHWYVTADGKVLGRSPKEALKKWQGIAEAERAGGAVKVGDLGDIDPLRTAPTPPVGGLIIKVYYRAFMRDGPGKLRYVVGKDLWHDEDGKKTEEKKESTYPGSITTPQAQPDHMWLTEAEWKSLIPAEPRQGDQFPLPAGITNRVIRWHLNPLSVYGETNALEPKAVRAGELTLTVDAVNTSSIRLRLEGFAKLGKEPPVTVAQGKCACIDQWGYEPRLFGFIEYDRVTKVITRFDVVSMGDHFGRLGIADSAARVGLQPLGISFELVTGNAPADRIPPGRTSTAKNYFK